MLKLEDFPGKLSGQPGFRGRRSEGLLGSVVQSKAALKWMISLEERDNNIGNRGNNIEMCVCT